MSIIMPRRAEGAWVTPTRGRGRSVVGVGAVERTVQPPQAAASVPITDDATWLKFTPTLFRVAPRALNLRSGGHAALLMADGQTLVQGGVRETSPFYFAMNVTSIVWLPQPATDYNSMIDGIDRSGVSIWVGITITDIPVSYLWPYQPQPAFQAPSSGFTQVSVA